MARKQLTQILELGVSHAQMNYHLLQDAVFALAVQNARQRLSFFVAGQTPLIDVLTDNSGGTASGSNLVNIPPIAGGIVDGTTAFATKAGFDTATAAIEAAHGEIANKINKLINAAITGQISVDYLHIEYAAVSGSDDTIAAITSTLVGATSGCVALQDARRELLKIRNVQANLVSAFNYLAVATGEATLGDYTAGMVFRDNVGWILDSSQERALTGDAAIATEETATVASVNAALEAAVDNIALLAASLNDYSGDLGDVTHVVATTNPRTRLRAAQPLIGV